MSTAGKYEQKSQNCYDSDLVEDFSCEYIGTGTKSDETLFDIYHDRDTGYLFMVQSDSSVDTVRYEPCVTSLPNYAWAPINSENALQKGNGHTYIDLLFVPSQCEEWSNAPGSGGVRLYGDGSFELRSFDASEGHSFKLSPGDLEILRMGIEPGYW